VENRLLDFRCLLEAAVVATPDEVLGEAVKVFLVSRMPDCQGFEECFLAFCKEHLPQELAPRATVLVDHLPKNSAGKVIKRDLEDLSSPDSTE
jgi:long-chain acyl-CoA synthetase